MDGISIFFLILSKAITRPVACSVVSGGIGPDMASKDLSLKPERDFTSDSTRFLS